MDEELSYKPFLEMLFANDQQFMTEEVFVEDEIKPITPEMVKMMDLVFDVTGSKTVMNRQKEIQDYDGFLQNYLPGLIKNGLAVPNGDTIEFNIPELMKRRLSMSSMRDIDSYMTVITKQEQEQQPQPMGAVSPELLNGVPNGLPQVPGALPPGPPNDMAAA
jgi:hypothetical protein